MSALYPGEWDYVLCVVRLGEERRGCISEMQQACDRVCPLTAITTLYQLPPTATYKHPQSKLTRLHRIPGALRRNKQPQHSHATPQPHSQPIDHTLQHPNLYTHLPHPSHSPLLHLLATASPRPRSYLHPHPPLSPPARAQSPTTPFQAPATSVRTQPLQTPHQSQHPTHDPPTVQSPATAPHSRTPQPSSPPPPSPDAWLPRLDGTCAKKTNAPSAATNSRPPPTSPYAKRTSKNASPGASHPAHHPPERLPREPARSRIGRGAWRCPSRRRRTACPRRTASRWSA